MERLDAGFLRSRGRTPSEISHAGRVNTAQSRSHGCSLYAVFTCIAIGVGGEFS